MQFLDPTCCEKMQLLNAALQHGADMLFEDLRSLVAEYAEGHKFVRPAKEGNILRSDADFYFGCPITLQALTQALENKELKGFKIVSSFWLKQECSTKTEAIVHYSAQQCIRQQVHTKGTFLQLSALGGGRRNARQLIVVHLDESDEVAVGILLHRYGDFKVRRSTCKVYTLF